MPSNKYQRKKAATQSLINTPTDKPKKALNITTTLATPPLTLITTTLIMTETASDSKHRDHLEAKLPEQQQQIDKLIKRVNQFERQVLILDSQLPVTEAVNSFLKKKADDLETFSRRSCIHVNGLEKDDHENNHNLRKTVVENISSKTGISKDNIERSIDKFQQTGKYNQTTKTQPVIVKFTSHSFKEQVYFKQKTIKNSNSNIRITPSLTHHRLELLNLTQSYLQEEYYNKKDDIYPKFTFADVHGNLKLVLNQPFKNRSVFSFSSVCEFHQIINKVTTRFSYPYENEVYDGDADEEAE